MRNNGFKDNDDCGCITSCVIRSSDDSALNIRQFKHGQSNPTYYVGYSGRDMVLRKKPPGKLLPSAHAVEREYQVMKALGGAGVPVPNLLALCEDERWVPGRVILHASIIFASHLIFLM